MIRKKKFARRTVTKKEWLLRETIYPQIGSRVIAELKPADVLFVLKKIEASGRLETAKRARQVIGQVFRLAAVTERATGDPTPLLRGMIKTPRVVSYPALIREDEFGALLRKIEEYPSGIVRLALKLLSLTFTRSSELRLATWKVIDDENGVWSIPETRMKMRRPHLVPLCAASAHVLAQARRLNPHLSNEENALIFPSPYSFRKPLSENTLSRR